MGPKRKRNEGGRGPQMETRQKRRAANAGNEESASQFFGILEALDLIKVEKPRVDPDKESNQLQLNDFTNQDLADSVIHDGDVKFGSHQAVQAPYEDKFTQKNEGVDELDSNTVNHEAETPSMDSNGGSVHAAHSTSEPSDSDAMVGQTESGNDTGATGREKDSERNANMCTTAKENPLQTEMTEQHEETIMLEDGHVDDDTIGSQLAGGTTAAERTHEILALLETAKKDVSMILTAGNQKDEKNVKDLLSTIQAKDEGMTRLAEELQTATGRIKLLQQEADSKNILIQELCSNVKLLEEKQRTLADENSMIKTQKEEADGEIYMLKNSILEKDHELAVIKVRYLRDQLGNFQLHLAAKKVDEPVVELLILLGADVNARNGNSETPIILAASSEGDANAILVTVKFLMEQGADVLATDGEGQTFLHKFASNKNPPSSSQFHDISDYLVSNNHTSLFNIRDTDNGQTPLMLAARNVDLDMATITLLETNGVDVNQFDNHGRSFLSYAAEGNRNLNLLRELREKGSIKYNNLTQAIAFEDVDSVNVLVRLGANVDETDDDFETPLHLAAMSRNKAFSINTIKLLIECGAIIDAKNEYGDLFLHQFVVQSFPIIPANQFHEMASFIISKDLCQLFNTPNDCGITPFHYAVRNVEIESATLQLLKEKGVNFNSVDKFEGSVLYYATCGNRTLRLITELVELGANSNQLTTFDKSCMLREAVKNKRLDLLNFFFNQRVDAHADMKI